MTATCARGVAARGFAAVSILCPATRCEPAPVIGAVQSRGADLVLGLRGAAFGVPPHLPSSKQATPPLSTLCIASPRLLGSWVLLGVLQP